MREITTHKVNGCNESITITVGEEITVGGAPTNYRVTARKYLVGDSPEVSFNLRFQDGPVNEVGNNGLTHEALLAIVIDRLQSFQKGPYACRENALALTKLEEATHWLHHRTRERLTRGVEGTSEK